VTEPETGTEPVFSAIDDQPIRRVHRDGVEYVLLGTAHVSRRSVDAVREIIASESFDAIAIELCEHRARSIEHPDSVAQMDLFRVLREGKAGVVAAGLALGAFQRRLADQFGIEPGAEMRAAMDEAKARGIDRWLIDRDVGLTLRRARAALGFWDRTTLTAGMIGSVLSSDEISESDVEKLKQGDMLASTFAEFSKQSEHLFRALISERDQFMAAMLRQGADIPNRPLKVLAVLGAGHLEGIAKQLDERREEPAQLLEPVSVEPPPSRFGAWFGVVLTLFILGGFVYGFAHSRRARPRPRHHLDGRSPLLGGALGATRGRRTPTQHRGRLPSRRRSRPLHPALASGHGVRTAVEAWVRKPLRRRLRRACATTCSKWQGWWRNRVARVFRHLSC
jgi:pheromone shutdown-related protein TraB